MIPIALSGDLSYNKDNIRRYVTEGGLSYSLSFCFAAFPFRPFPS